MREILFKAKRMDNEEWIEGSLIVLDADSGYYFIAKPYLSSSTLPVRNLIYDHTYLVIPETICQYTGLTDKNGNKIWENDVVKDKYLKYRVVWDEEEGSWMLESISVARYSVAGIGRINSETFEVIGNIFDNPELLKINKALERMGEDE